MGDRGGQLVDGSLDSIERAPRASKRCDDGGGTAALLTSILAAQLTPARSQMAFTLGFHIILASLGVAFPAIMLIANYIGLRRNDADALLLAQRWSKVGGGDVRRRRGHRHGAVVRVRPPVAGVHGAASARCSGSCSRSRGSSSSSRRSSSRSTSSAGSGCRPGRTSGRACRSRSAGSAGRSRSSRSTRG